MLTWKKDDGIKIYYNSELQADDDVGLDVYNTTTVPFKSNLLVGRNVANSGPLANFQMASLTIFGSSMTQDDVDRSYIFFWSGCKWNISCIFVYTIVEGLYSIEKPLDFTTCRETSLNLCTALKSP